MIGQVGREAETQAGVTALCDTITPLKKAEGRGGLGGMQGGRGAVRRGHGKKLILQ